METHRHGSDDRRIFTTHFKHKQVAWVVRQELTVAELAWKLAISTLAEKFRASHHDVPTSPGR